MNLLWELFLVWQCTSLWRSKPTDWRRSKHSRLPYYGTRCIRFLYSLQHTSSSFLFPFAFLYSLKNIAFFPLLIVRPPDRPGEMDRLLVTPTHSAAAIQRSWSKPFLNAFFLLQFVRTSLVNHIDSKKISELRMKRPGCMDGARALFLGAAVYPTVSTRYFDGSSK